MRVALCTFYGAQRHCHDIPAAGWPGPRGPGLPARVFLGWLQTGFMGDPRETWLLEDAAGAGGWYLLELPSRDNGHLGSLEIQVAPGRRRHGLGTALLRHAAGRAVADGRRLLCGYAVAGTGGEAFARAAGAAGGQTDVRRAYTVMACHDGTGEPAGLTMVEVGPERPDWGFQALTAVAREHRGRRLGLRLKLAMLDLLADREPQVRHILTSNAETNGHMI